MRKIKYFHDFFPFRLNLFIFLVILILAYYVGKKFLFIEQVSDSREFLILGGLIIGFLLLLVSLGLSSVLFSYLFFGTYKRGKIKKAGLHQVEVKLGSYLSTHQGLIPLTIEVPGVLIPLLGYVKARVFFKDWDYTVKVDLDKPLLMKSKKNGRKCETLIYLPHRKEYTVQKVVLFFEDMLRFFSFPWKMESPAKITSLPAKQPARDFEFLPEDTETQVSRVKIRRFVKGELLNYKKFESSDDIRRIVWKIYGKNRELMVRVPDMSNPYASDVKLLASFYNSFNIYRGEKVNAQFLDFYKDNLRLMMDSIQKEGFKVKLLADQDSQYDRDFSDIDPNLLKICSMNWQENKPVENFLHDHFPKNRKSPVIVCLTSLVSVKDLEFLNNLNTETIIYFIKVSEIFRQKKKFGLIHLFVQKVPDEASRERRSWRLPFYKRMVKKNERKLAEFFKDNGIKVVT